MTASLEDIRARLQVLDNNNSGKFNTGDHASYPFWLIPENTTAVLRFLPDADDNNPFFWVERNIIKLPFSGILGDAESKQTMVHVPCMELWGESCPVLTEVRPWFNDPSLKDMARAYWKKRSYIFNGFVVDGQLVEDLIPENPIRRFTIGPQIYAIIKNVLMDPEIENLPTEKENGLDFRLIKTTKGEYNDYSTSNWARKERSLSDEERAAVEKYGLFNLSDFLPKKPNEIELSIIKEMFEDSVDGKPYNVEKYSKYYRPIKLSYDINVTPVSNENVNVNVSTDDTIVETEKASTIIKTDVDVINSKKSAQDILKQIRDRENI